MRQRVQAKLRKQIRRARHGDLGLVPAVRRYERKGISTETALRNVMLDPAAGWCIRSEAGRILAMANDDRAGAALLSQFFEQEEETELFETALTLESLGDPRTLRLLIGALYDANLHRRRGAARVLGWNRRSGSREARALVRTLTDTSQPQFVRAEAAESLAYLYFAPSIPALISVLSDPDVEIRFWAVFALGSICGCGGIRQTDHRVVSALDAMLSDDAAPAGNWWSIGREALAMLGQLIPPITQYREQLAQEIQRVLDDPNSSHKDRWWAEGYKGRLRTPGWS